jgi:gamma-glutamyltranspeptidase/glutathione hydrolase
MQIERRVSPDAVKGLQAKGHKVQLSGEWSMGSMQAIVGNPETGAMTAGGDPRRTVYAIGW